MAHSFKNFLDGRGNNIRWENLDIDNFELIGSLGYMDSAWDERLEVSTEFNVLHCACSLVSDSLQQLGPTVEHKELYLISCDKP